MTHIPFRFDFYGRYRVCMETPLPSVAWRAPRDEAEARLAHILAGHAGPTGVPPYSPSDDPQPARLGDGP